jgi:hypothetical protein
MPSWEPCLTETVLDIDIHFYDWGNEALEDRILVDKFVQEIPVNAFGSSGGMDKFLSKQKPALFRPDPLKGYHPDDLIDDHWEDSELTEKEN